MLYLYRIQSINMRKSIFISIAGIMVLLLLQGFWLYNMYSSYKITFQKEVETLFDQSIKKELSARMFGPNRQQVTIKSARSMVANRCR